MNCENWWLWYTSSSIFSPYSIQYSIYKLFNIFNYIFLLIRLKSFCQITFVYFLHRLGEGAIISILDGCITAEVWCSIGWITRAKNLQVTCEIKFIVCQSLPNHAFNMIYWVVFFQWPIFPQFRQLSHWEISKRGFCCTRSTWILQMQEDQGSIIEPLYWIWQFSAALSSISVYFHKQKFFCWSKTQVEFTLFSIY